MSTQDEMISFVNQEAERGHIPTLQELTHKFRVSIRAAHAARAQFLAANPQHLPSIRGAGRSGRKPRSTRPADAVQSSYSTFVKDILSGDASALSTEQQRSVLSGLILNSQNEAVKVAAQNALTRLDAQAGSALVTGPGAPLSDAETIERLSNLMRSVGLVVVRAALRASFPKAFARYDTIFQEVIDANPDLARADS